VTLLEYRPLLLGGGGPHKPFSWLSEGVSGMFTMNTETGETVCVPHLHIRGTPSGPRGWWCGQTSLRNFSS
jgi:hypothetical protein